MASNMPKNGCVPRYGAAELVPLPVFLCTDLSCSTAGGVQIVQGFSVSLPYGGAMLLEGSSGCGKSTLLRGLAGLHLLTAGTVQMPPSEQVCCGMWRSWMVESQQAACF